MKTPCYIVNLVIIVILSMVVFTATANTVITHTDEKSHMEKINELLNTVYDDILTYVKIDRVIGKYEFIDGQQVLSQLAIQIHSLFTKDIQINDMIIECSNGYEIRYYSYYDHCDTLSNYSLFSHPLFEEITTNSFGVITIMDKDNSIKNDQLLNHYSDRLFIIINLKDSFQIKSGESCSLTLHFSVGTMRTISIETLFSTKPIVDLF